MIMIPQEHRISAPDTDEDAYEAALTSANEGK
jgi:hypothetical protein